MFTEGVATLRAWLLEALFPEHCLGCRAPDFLLCPACWQNNPVFTQATGVWRCPVCHKKTQGEPCVSCADISTLSQIIALEKYDHTSVSGKLLEYFKYQSSVEAVRLIEMWIANNVSILQKLGLFDVIIPLPLHPRRAAERGFNQAEIIARAVAKTLNKPIFTDVLVRSRFTKQQAKLTLVERATNVRGAFACPKTDLIQNQVCLLVDDVYTTGNTLQAAAQTLRQAGAKSILGFTLFRPVQV